MNNFQPMIDSECLIAQARLAIRCITHESNKEDVSAALAAVMRCASYYGWNQNACSDMIFKSWSKRENTCATVRRRRKAIMAGLVGLVVNTYEMEAKVRAIEFKQQMDVSIQEQSSEVGV